MRFLRGRPRRPPEEDPRLVGISFVDVLFALVIAEALNPVKNWGKIPGVGLSHLALTIVLVITSWIGYHNSLNRPTYFIRFSNLPLWQFVADILLVGVYWFAAVSAEGSGNSVAKPWSALPEVVAVTISFVLYVAWDRIGWAIRRNDRYGARKKEYDTPVRRRVTEWCLLAALVIFGYVLLDEPHSRAHIVVVDGLLAALLLAFRFAKEHSGKPEVGFVFRHDAAQGLWRAECDDGSEISASSRTKQEAEQLLAAALKDRYGRECKVFAKDPHRRGGEGRR